MYCVPRFKVSLARYKVTVGWSNTNFIAQDLRIYFYDGHGNNHQTSPVAPSSTASQGYFHVKWLSGRSYEMWDERKNY